MQLYGSEWPHYNYGEAKSQQRLSTKHLHNSNWEEEGPAVTNQSLTLHQFAVFRKHIVSEMEQHFSESKTFNI